MLGLFEADVYGSSAKYSLSSYASSSTTSSLVIGILLAPPYNLLIKILKVIYLVKLINEFFFFEFINSF